MKKINNSFCFLKKISVNIIIISVLALFAILLLLFNTVNTNQAGAPIHIDVKFIGEYSIDGGEWEEYSSDKHISSTKGDVSLRGVFHYFTHQGEDFGPADENTEIMFYLNHINLSVNEENFETFVMDNENSSLGSFACGKAWNGYHLIKKSTKPIEMVVHNPHKFGNENAIDDMLSNLSIGGIPEFEKDVTAAGNGQRTIGLMFFVASIVMFGTALFSTMLHLKSGFVIWSLGLVTLFASAYFIYSSWGTYFWSEKVAFNTVVLIISIMFYMFFLLELLRQLLKKTKNAAKVIVGVLGVFDICFLITALFFEVLLFDTLLPWICIQTVANILFLICLIIDFVSEKTRKRWQYLFYLLPIIAFQIDGIAMHIGIWNNGIISKSVFVLLFITVLIVVWQIIPNSINAAIKAKELESQRNMLEAEKNAIEAELKESRVAIMLSQIQPHFIYNTLGTIERMCLKSPEKAFELVRNFSLYLRGNFSELESTTPIRFLDEMKHVKHYINIEQARFPDMIIKYDLQATEFVLPALSVQPLVENAIKHGLMRLETGGTVIIKSYETDTHFCVLVRDDGIGFDIKAPLDEKKHVGLRNIRGRLKAIVNGELIIESVEGSGTDATIMIPKE